MKIQVTVTFKQEMPKVEGIYLGEPFELTDGLAEERIMEEVGDVFWREVDWSHERVHGDVHIYFYMNGDKYDLGMLKWEDSYKDEDVLGEAVLQRVLDNVSFNYKKM